MLRPGITSSQRPVEAYRTENRIGRRIRLAACAGATAGALTLSLAPVSHADGDWEELISSYRDPSPDDQGGYDASASLLPGGSGQNRASAWFTAHGETLRLSDSDGDGLRTQAEVRVYRHADADGIPYDLIDTDTFSTGSDHSVQYNLGTPDGSGNISDGRWVAIRISVDGEPWSSWAYGIA
jgi:hypothetical protein